MGAAHSVPIDSVLGRPHPKLGEGNWSRFMMKGPHAGKKKKAPFLNGLQGWGGSPNCLPEFLTADSGAGMPIRLT